MRNYLSRIPLRVLICCVWQDCKPRMHPHLMFYSLHHFFSSSLFLQISFCNSLADGSGSGKRESIWLFAFSSCNCTNDDKSKSPTSQAIHPLSIQAGHTCSFIFFTHPGKWFGIGPQWVQITEDVAIVIQGIWAIQDFTSFHPQSRDAKGSCPHKKVAK